MVLWHLWIGRARHPGPGSAPFLFEVLNVGRWLARSDFSMGAEVDFLAVVEHRLILARVRGEWARLRCKRLASIWAPVCVVLLFRCLLLPLFSFSVFLIVVGLLGVCASLVWW